MAEYAPGKGPEFKLLKQFLQFFLIEPFVFQCFFINCRRDIGNDRSQLFRQNTLIPILFYIFTQLALELVGIGHKVFNGIKLFEQLHGRFGADAGNAGDIVGGVALQTEYIPHLVRTFYIKFLQNFIHSQNVNGIAHIGRFVQINMILDQLCEILVGSHHKYFKTLSRGMFGKRADNIIGFIPL